MTLDNLRSNPQAIAVKKMTYTFQSSKIVLRNGDMQVQIAPEIGGSITEFSSTRGNITHHWLRPASNASLLARDPLGMASFPLIPWCNRLRDGKSNFAGKILALKPNFGHSPHTIHGVGWTRAWELLSSKPDQAILQLRHERDEWPYRFIAQQVFTLAPNDGLTVQMTITNMDDTPMPVGMGHHPYLPRYAGATLKVDLKAMWESDPNLLPTKLTQPAVLAALRAGCDIENLNLDNNFTGWSRISRVEWPATGTALEMHSLAPLNFFVIYCRPQLDHFCIEPVSNCTDWLNLPHIDKAHIGGQSLGPSEQMRVSFTLRPEWST